ncbi:MAG: acyl-CoA dehydrogenase family protein [Candidatus Marinimicrobia bacterium]|nr:acyl-CoA dehydrogenase family protein [Candidatus Neomarinimicrobiota bacterium]MDA1363774.1 acyl-CoA dehydrogenase family protein [Candidatus Neomarinimicrobiota bacterium]
MNFNLSEDQKFFRETIRSFVDKEIRPVVSELEKSGTYPDEIVKKMKDMGLFGILIPEEYGGQNIDMVSMAILFEELSRGWMGIAGIIGSHSLSTWMINKHGTEEQKNQFLPGLATGEIRTGVGLTEPDAGTDLQGIKTKAVLDGDHYIVNGSKMWITNARHANPLPVLVKTDTKADPPHKGMSVLLMDQNSEGFEISKDIGKMGYKGPESCLIMFSDVKVDKSMLLGGVEGKGLQQVLSALEIGRLNVAARAVGIAQESYNQALSYSKERKAFGKEINQFQAIQLKLAEMATNVQAARLLTWWSASMADEGKRVDAEAGMAKYYASEVAISNSLDSMRIHGGMGYSTEYSIERLYRDAPLMAIGEGTNDIMKTIIARTLIKGDLIID